MEVQIGQSKPTQWPAMAQPSAPTAAKPSIWSDPNLLAIMLGTMGQAVMGEHQQSWQAQVGKGATGLGQSFKMADIVARREQERKEDRDWWRKAFESISGRQAPQEAETMKLGGMGGMSGPGFGG